MVGIEQVSRDDLARLKGILTDIDDTITLEGKLRPRTYEALWRLHDVGLRVIPITGRPAGWCDHIARYWPVDAVVGENGGFYFYHDGTKLRRRFLYSDEQRAEFRQRLITLREKILAEFPTCAVASDQPYREYDLAIDFCEDVEPLPQEGVLRIKEIFERTGAHAKISSIHVNGWFGDFDKLSTTKLCIKELFDVDLETDNKSFAFCGDSPNDEPMFAFFQLSFAMANIARFQDMLTHTPAYITNQPNDDGFCEVADLILQARREQGGRG
ncbi:MAG: HAD-IIB family hydrolase [Planctomycetota bacterium]|jgi:HAD superfamily hydrolase (TIGR01484 family)